jgi:glycosyltransferase involved in cell wall biosynthesis
MRVLLISNYEPDRQHSMLKFADWLEASLAGGDIDIHRIRPPVVFGRLLSGGGFNKWLRYIDKFVLGAAQCLYVSRRFDIAHVLDHSNSMLAIFCRSKRVVINCHDVLAIQASRGGHGQLGAGFSGRLFQNLIALCLRYPDSIICISDNTRNEILRLLPRARAETIAMPLNRAFSLEGARAEIDSGPYLLHVGGSNWYKNRTGLLRIVAALRAFERFRAFRLVLAGRELSEAERALAAALQIADACVEVCDPADEALDALYRGAQALVFPSLEEGFGWPIIEARALGCPVVTSNRPPMSQIAGPFGLLIDPDLDPEINARRIAESWDALQTTREHNKRGLELYAPEVARAKYLAHYHRVLAQ